MSEGSGLGSPIAWLAVICANLLRDGRDRIFYVNQQLIRSWDPQIPGSTVVGGFGFVFYNDDKLEPT